MTKPERGLAFTDKEGDGGPHGSCLRTNEPLDTVFAGRAMRGGANGRPVTRSRQRRPDDLSDRKIMFATHVTEALYIARLGCGLLGVAEISHFYRYL